MIKDTNEDFFFYNDPLSELQHIDVDGRIAFPIM